jgi:hypothetical protein
LRNPGESLGEIVVGSIKEDSFEAEGVLDRVVFLERCFDAAMPDSDTWVEAEPMIMEPLSLVYSPAPLSSGSSRRASIVTTVNRVFAFLTFLTSRVRAFWKLAKLNTPHIFSILDVDIDAFSKGFFEVFIVCLPGYYLRICAFEISLEHDIISVGDEEFSDVW